MHVMRKYNAKPQRICSFFFTILRNTLRMNIREILGEEEHDFNLETKIAKRKRCSVCEGSEKSRTWFCCAFCGEAVCEKHRTYFSLGCSVLHSKE